MNIREYPDSELMMMSVADQLASELGTALRQQDRVTFAVPGGTTPGPVFDSLCAVDLDWDRVDLILTDERWVPETSERSNTRLIRERLLVEKAAAARLLPYYAPAERPEDVIGETIEAIEGLLPISVLLLGMGEDMHTASLIPGADRLDAAMKDHAPALMALRAPGYPEPRVTLTAPVLKDALNIHLLITGPEKRAALDRAARLNDPLKAPVSILLRDATVHWAE